MKIKNYTSTVPVSRTISKIEEILASAGVNGIQKDYKEGELKALSFCISLPNKRPVTIRLPADCDAVYATLLEKVKRRRKSTVDRVRDQAQRTAWKLMQDWVAVQITLIHLQKADFLQVFLSYVWDGEKTFYTAIKDGGYKNLLPEHAGS